MSKSIYLLLLAVLLVFLLGAGYLFYTSQQRPPVSAPSPAPVTPQPTQPVTSYLILKPTLVRTGNSADLTIAVAPQAATIEPLGIIVMKLDVSAPGQDLTPMNLHLKNPTLPYN